MHTMKGRKGRFSYVTDGTEGEGWGGQAHCAGQAAAATRARGMSRHVPTTGACGLCPSCRGAFYSYLIKLAIFLGRIWAGRCSAEQPRATFCLSIAITLPPQSIVPSVARAIQGPADLTQLAEDRVELAAEAADFAVLLLDDQFPDCTEHTVSYREATALVNLG